MLGDITSKEQLESYIENDMVKLEYTVSHSRLFECAEHVALTLFPEWKKEDLKFVQCKDGLTNKLVKCTNKAQKFTILIRAYGNKSEVLIDRKQEIMTLVVLSKLGLSPPLYGRFSNGFVYGFVPGEVLSVEDLSDPHKSKLIAKNLATWHSVSIVRSKEPTLFPTLRKWLSEVPASYTNPETNARFTNHFNLSTLNEELINLQRELEKIGAPVVFCHNDLLNGNIIYNEAENKVTFIDYEYGSWGGYRGMDIGNHFNEFAGLACDYTLYPKKDFQFGWLRHYLSALQPVVSDNDVYQLYREVNKFALASHFYWGLWSLIQAQLSDINFDYMEYAILRFNEYYRRKDEFLAL